MGSTFFGHSDATYEKETLQQYFYRQPFFNEMKLKDKDEGVFITVGVKGSGKTALCQTIEYECADQIVWKLEQYDGFEPIGKMTHPAIAQNILTTVIATGVIDRIRKLAKSDRGVFSSEAIDSIKQLEDGPLQKITKFLTSTGKFSLDLTGPRIEFDFSKMKEEKDLDEFQRIPIDDYVNAMSSALQEHKAYVLIDDIDAIFPGGEQQDGFIEGIVNSCTRLNTAFGKYLHCLLFLNAGMYEKYFKSARTYDKCKEFVGKITWNANELAEMLAMRIRYRLGITQTEELALTSWGRVFSGNTEQDINNIQKYMIERCNSGPRDIITFANFARDKSGQSDIDMSHIQLAEGDFSHEKLFLLNREYGLEYEKLAELLQAVFAGKPASYRGVGKLEEYISTNLFGNSQIRQTYGELDYIRFGQPRSFLELLYTIGFIGYRKDSKMALTFSMSCPDPGDQLFNASEHKIHLAYHRYLGLK